MTEAEPECRAALLAAGCIAPLDRLSTSFLPLAEQAARLEEAISACPPEVGDRVVRDCTEFPCLALVPRDLLAAEASCRWLDDIRERDASDDTIRLDDPAGLTGSWVAVPRVGTGRSFQSDLPLFERRLPSRLERIRGRARSPAGGATLADDCPTVRRKLAAFEADPCVGLARARDCAGSEPTLPADLVARHLAESADRVRRLSTACPAFAERAHVLSCDPLPCVLGVDAPEPLPFPRGPLADCDPFLTDGLDVVTAITTRDDPCGQTAIYPLTGLGGGPEQTTPLYEAYWETRSSRLGQVCLLVEARRDAAEAAED